MNYHKIPSLGSVGTDQIFNGEYIIQEKFDGSQFSWEVDHHVSTTDNNIEYRALKAYSKNKELDLTFGLTEKLFVPAVTHIMQRWQEVYKHKMKNLIFFAETLCSPRHNKLKYERVPINNIILFDIYDKEKGEYITSQETLKYWAGIWNIEWVRHWDQTEMAGLVKDNLLDKIFTEESILGGANIEGVVIKNYGQSNSKTGYKPLMVKYVSPSFKEVKERVKHFPTRNENIKEFMESFRTEARWDKAIQRYKEGYDFPLEDREIGPLIKDIQVDLIKEEKENIKEWLWETFKSDILKTSVRGFAEYFKGRLRDE